MEIPEYIRFDFLLVVLGGISVYLSITLGNTNEDAKFLLLFIGALSFVVGISFVKYNYDLDMEIKELEYAKMKSEYIEFFDKKEVLTKKSKEEHIKDIKDIIN